MSSPRRIGVFGGTFDPPHLGHLIAAQEALSVLELDHVLWVPSGEPPHRPEGARSPGARRLELVREAIRGNASFMAWDGEIQREGPSYTVDTLRALNARVEGEAEWWLLIGSDQYRAFRTWRSPEEVVRLARLAVLVREGDAPECDGPFPHHTVPLPRIDVSSTEIRRRCQEGRTIRYLVPDGVRRLLEREALYV